MNDPVKHDHEAMRALMLLSELEKGEPVSQREISSRLGIALGLVNAYLKKLVSKGFVTVKTYPRNRYAYLLTPKGFAEKSRLAFSQVAFFNKVFQVTRSESLKLFEELREKEYKAVAFVGMDEFTEIAYLSLVEAQLELVCVIEQHQVGGDFFSVPIHSVETFTSEYGGQDYPCVITSFRDFDFWSASLKRSGIDEGQIFQVHKGVV